MTPEEITIIRKENDKITEWRQLVNDLEDQLELSADEMRDGFEKQIKNLSDWLRATLEKMDDLKEISSENAKVLKYSMEVMRQKIKDIEAKSGKELKQYQTQIAEGIEILKNDFHHAYRNGEDKSSAFMENFNDSIERFQLRFNLFHKQFNHEKDELKESWEEKRDKLVEKLEELKIKIEKEKEKGSEYAKNFLDDMSKAWQQFKSSFEK